MGQLTHLMIHCTDTPAIFDVTPEHIRKWHIEERGWSKVGYSALFMRDGSTEILIPWDADDEVDYYEVSNGARGWNGKTRHFVWAGGRTDRGKNAEDNRTSGQKSALEATCKIMTMLHPNIKLIGHNQTTSKKYCPSFNVPQWANDIGIPQKNIDFKTYY